MHALFTGFPSVKRYALCFCPQSYQASPPALQPRGKMVAISLPLLRKVVFGEHSFVSFSLCLSAHIFHLSNVFCLFSHRPWDRCRHHKRLCFLHRLLGIHPVVGNRHFRLDSDNPASHVGFCVSNLTFGTLMTASHF
jgi:hypothetical protein